jgi:hypothetical protein
MMTPYEVDLAISFERQVDNPTWLRAKTLIEDQIWDQVGALALRRVGEWPLGAWFLVEQQAKEAHDGSR